MAWPCALIAFAIPVRAGSDRALAPCIRSQVVAAMHANRRGAHVNCHDHECGAQSVVPMYRPRCACPNCCTNVHAEIRNMKLNHRLVMAALTLRTAVETEVLRINPSS